MWFTDGVDKASFVIKGDFVIFIKEESKLIMGFDKFCFKNSIINVDINNEVLVGMVGKKET